VRRNEAIVGGIVFTISEIFSSEITPGPLGIAETNPNADAPLLIASWDSSTELIQQIFTRMLFNEILPNKNGWLIKKSPASFNSKSRITFSSL